jgi:hypothetical protein
MFTVETLIAHNNTTEVKSWQFPNVLKIGLTRPLVRHLILEDLPAAPEQLRRWRSASARMTTSEVRRLRGAAGDGDGG